MFYLLRIRKRHVITALCTLSVLAVGASLLSGGGAEYCTNELIAAAAIPDSAPQSAPAESAPAVDEEKVAYLTFDDGPSKTTADVLDVLKKYGVRATFFVCAAENNQEYLPLLARTAEEGHQIALHSCTHSYKKIYQSPESYWADIEELKTQISPYVQTPLTCLRFPGGSTNTVSHKYGGSSIMKVLKAQATEKGYRYFDWNSCAEDAVGARKSPETLVRNVVKEAGERKRLIVLMHDTDQTGNTVKALPQIITTLREQGYVFDVVENYPPTPAKAVGTEDEAPSPH